MRIDVLRAGELKPGEIDRWRAAHTADPGAHPVLSPDYVLAVGASRDVRVAVMDRDGARGWFAYENGPGWCGGPVGSGLTDLGGITHEPGFRCHVGALLRACGMHALRYTRPAGAPWPATCSTRHGVFERGRMLSPVVDLSQGFEAYLAERRRHSRKQIPELIRRGRRIRRDHDVRVEHDARDPGLVRTMLAWKQARIRSMGHRARLGACAADVELVRRVAALDEPTCRGRLTVLHVDGRPAGFHLGIHDDRTMAGLILVHGTEFGKYSPGLLVVLEAIEQAAALGLRRYDCGGGDQRYKLALATGREELVEGVLWRPGPPGAALFARHGGELAAREFVLRHPRVRAAVRDGLRAYGARRSR